MVRTIALALLCAVCACVAPALAGDGAVLGTEGYSLHPWQHGSGSWETAVRAIGDDSLYILTSPLRLTAENAVIAGGAGLGIVALSLADRDIHHEVGRRRHDSVRDAADIASQLGNAPVLLALNVGGIVVGEGIRQYNGNATYLDAALVATEAQILTLLLSEGIGYATARSTPRESSDPFRFKLGRSSFPSSHASQAFAVAAVLSDRYEQPVGSVAYGLAGLVGLARLVQDRHWASDVAAGSALGWAVGHSLSRRHAERHPYLDFFPFADPGTRTYGFAMMGEF